MATVKCIVHQGFVGRTTGNKYLKGDNVDVDEKEAKSAALHGWVGIYPKKKKKKK